MTHNTEAERAEFEQLVRNKWPLANITRSEDWGYLDDDVDSKFFIWQAARHAPAVPVPQSIEQMAVDRYKVVPSHSSMFYPCAVVAGDGQQQLYTGRAVECQNMARKFTGAFLDGAFVALATAPRPPDAFQTEGGLKSEIRTTSTAPVQMPEPAGCVVYANGELHHWDANRECAELFASSERSRGAPYAFTFENLYTEQQVRQLLADNGIGKDKA